MSPLADLDWTMHVGLDPRPAIVTEEVVAATRAEFMHILFHLPAHGIRPFYSLRAERWDEVMRRCQPRALPGRPMGYGLCLREAAWLVIAEWASGRPSCWLR